MHGGYSDNTPLNGLAATAALVGGRRTKKCRRHHKHNKSCGHAKSCRRKKSHRRRR